MPQNGGTIEKTKMVMESVKMNNDIILLNDEYWFVKTFGPRYFTARSKWHDEHRIYYSRDAVERDFGRRINWNSQDTVAAAGGGDE